MKIDSCLIIKNEEENIKGLINQLLKFSNEVHITDTGSTDNTVNIVNELMSYNSNLYLHYFEWCDDFSKARNYSLTCYDCNADYQFWCDGDDELNDTLIDTLNNFDGTDDLYFIYYQYSEESLHLRTSLLKVSCNYKWYDPIHEYISYEESEKLNYDYFDNGSLIIHHKKNFEEHNNRNLKIFRKMETSKYKFNSRNRFYYGRELYHNGFNDCATYQLCKCIDEDDGFYLNKIIACRYLFFIDENIGLEYFYKLFKREYIRKDLLYYAGNVYYNKSNYMLAKYFYILCINTDEPDNELNFDYETDCHISALFQLNLLEFYQFKNMNKSIYYNEEILKIDPNNEIAASNVKIINNILNNINNESN